MTPNKSEYAGEHSGILSDLKMPPCILLPGPSRLLQVHFKRALPPPDPLRGLICQVAREEEAGTGGEGRVQDQVCPGAWAGQVRA